MSDNPFLAYEIARLQKALEDGTITADEQREGLLNAMQVQSSPASMDVNTEILRFFREQKEDAVEPWKAQQRWAQAHFAEIDKGVNDPMKRRAAMRRKFIADAENGLLAPLEVLLAQYTIFSDNLEDDIHRLQGILTQVAPEDRVRLHNWNVFQAFTDVEKMTWGGLIDQLKVPLFPRWPHPGCEKLETLNTLLLTEERSARSATADVSGGGSRVSSRTLKPRTSQLYQKSNNEILGGGYMAPVYNQDGEQTGVADLSEMEAYVVRLQQMVQEMPANTQPDWKAVTAEIIRGLGMARNGTKLRTITPSLNSLRRYGSGGNNNNYHHSGSSNNNNNNTGAGPAGRSYNAGNGSGPYNPKN